jgi:hypothetical protein
VRTPRRIIRAPIITGRLSVPTLTLRRPLRAPPRPEKTYPDDAEDGYANGDADDDNGGNGDWGEGGAGTDWWDREDPAQQWMTQATRLLPNTTIVLWQFTP